MQVESSLSRLYAASVSSTCGHNHCSRRCLTLVILTIDHGNHIEHDYEKVCCPTRLHRIIQAGRQRIKIFHNEIPSRTYQYLQRCESTPTINCRLKRGSNIFPKSTILQNIIRPTLQTTHQTCRDLPIQAATLQRQRNPFKSSRPARSGPASLPIPSQSPSAVPKDEI